MRTGLPKRVSARFENAQAVHLAGAVAGGVNEQHAFIDQVANLRFGEIVALDFCIQGTPTCSTVTRSSLAFLSHVAGFAGDVGNLKNRAVIFPRRPLCERRTPSARPPRCGRRRRVFHLR
jgi:hypothetical protein